VDILRLIDDQMFRIQWAAHHRDRLADLLGFGPPPGNAHVPSSGRSPRVLGDEASFARPSAWSKTQIDRPERHFAGEA
jgi:hypothetical protein